MTYQFDVCRSGMTFLRASPERIAKRPLPKEGLGVHFLFPAGVQRADRQMPGDFHASDTFAISKPNSLKGPTMTLRPDSITSLHRHRFIPNRSPVVRKRRMRNVTNSRAAAGLSPVESFFSWSANVRSGSMGVSRIIRHFH